MTNIERIFDAAAKHYMFQWNYEDFKKTHPRLLLAIWEAMNTVKACSLPNVVGSCSDGFEDFILKRHPDPDSMTMMDEFGSKKNGEIRIGMEWEQVVKLAEEYAEKKVIEYRKEQIIKKGLKGA